MNNYMHITLIHAGIKVCDEITCPFPNINGSTIVIPPTIYNGSNYLSMLGLKSIHVSKRGPWGMGI